ncbi:MAG: peptidoglycan DL-endopeptidase CwlO [Gaiellaceae bacterium]|nr:peptidoglycan DL-endopeptidase CwlO [Gaiellaceae bacterium]
MLVTYRPLLRGRLSSLSPPSGSTRRKAPALVIALAAAFALTTASASADPSIASKEAQAQSVLGQIQQLDSSLERAIEAYNLATVKLNRIKHDLGANTAALAVAKTSLKRSQTQLSTRLVDIYTSGDQNAGLSVLLGASSLDDMLGRMDAADRISAQDTLVLHQVARFRREVQHRQQFLQHAHSQQTQIVAQRDAARASVESQLGQRKALLGSIQGEIQHMKAAEAARQAQLRQQLQQQLAQQQAAQRQTALAPTVPVATPSASPSIAPPPARYGGVVGIAMQYLGRPYVWGGASPSGFDCSGLVMYVYGQIGVSLPHSSYAQYGYGSPVSRGDLQPGDLVFFDGLGHVGIYVGNGSFIHAPHTGDVVKISSLSGWYAATYVGARRL